MDLSQFKVRSFIIGVIALGAIVTLASLGISRIYKNYVKPGQNTVVVTIPTPTPTPTPTNIQGAATQQTQGGQAPATQPSTGSDTVEVKNPGVYINNVSAGDTIATPVTVNGRANVTNSKIRIEIWDQNGTILASSEATACLWYDACPFTATLYFNSPSTKSGRLVVYNPADDGSKLYLLQIPVSF